MSDPPRELGNRHQSPQVSLRGASSKEITRDALLHRVSYERELRNYQRRQSAAALSIQRIWRGCSVRRKVVDQLEEQLEEIIRSHDILPTWKWISSKLLRPFLLFATPARLKYVIHSKNSRRISYCFNVLLQSIKSSEPEKNFCSLALGTSEEKDTWHHQARRLLSLSSFILSEFDPSEKDESKVQLISSGMRLIISLTDTSEWMIISSKNINEAKNAVNKLINFMITTKCGLYMSVRIYLKKLDENGLAREVNLVVTVSAITLVLRPFNSKSIENDGICFLEAKYAVEQYCNLILTIPYLGQRLPHFLLPALRHPSSLSPCLQVPLIISEISNVEEESSNLKVPAIGWFLANMISLSTECSKDSGKFIPCLNLKTYTHFIYRVSEKFMNQIQSTEPITKDYLDDDSKVETLLLRASFMELLKPVHQQWFLRNLLSTADMSTSDQGSEFHGNPHFLDVLMFYYNMVRIYASLDPRIGPLSILNMLSFTRGFIEKLWELLEGRIFNQSTHFLDAEEATRERKTSNEEEKMVSKVSGNKWANVLAKITGKLSDTDGSRFRNDDIIPSHVFDDECEFWVVNSVNQGCQGVSKEMQCILYLFCSVYAHLLLVLDDIEFYDKQEPFTLSTQKRISSVLNTFVYGSFIHDSDQNNKLVIDVAVRCLTLLYERDSRHQFCSPSLWVAPAWRNRLPIPAAARSHEAFSSNPHLKNSSGSQRMSSVISTIPHVFPFEERVQMFREFIKLDKDARRAAGELTGPGPGSIAIVIRRDHIIEDGFKQLNFLGSRLKSSFNISFVSESGLPEAGLDYGGLSKEFLTDISKAAFDPKYGFFCQSSTSEGFLVPNTSARFLENGIEMIEFLGRMVGKALYEGFLLEYCFSLAFIQKLVGRYSFLDELSALDPELYRNLMYIKNYDGDVKELALDFTVEEEILGKRTVVELKPCGKSIAVTNENKFQYVYAVADYKLNLQILPFVNAFYRGLTDLISPSWLSIFTAKEFNQLLSGGKHDFDVEDLRSNTKYTGGYSESSRTVKLFWEVIRGFSSHERSLLLKFVTSCSRGPLLGFKHLQPAFTIHKVPCDMPLWVMIGGQDVDRLPSASTCSNTLKLPTYKRASTLRSKLLYAVNSSSGFELS